MTTLTCEDVVQAHVQYLGGQFSCYRDEKRLWIVSPFAHLDRDLIELTVDGDDHTIRVSDLGETLRHLAGLGFDPLGSPKSEYLISEILKDHGAELRHGAIAKAARIEALGETFQDVLAACVAVAHLVYLSRGYRAATFQEEVANYLASHGVLAGTAHKEMGRSGKRYSIDFYARAGRSEALFEALSAGNAGNTTAKVNAAFRLWSDVANHRWRSSLIDDRIIVWRTEDITLLRNVSDVYYWSERDEKLASTLDLFLREKIGYPG